ncbi:MAG: hypothetical protein E6Q97_35640 [Desulfurellales bacterium]|nr:MAG: hypothetical protein E6Q97_35640 [Desulfurellales bacterium]
MDMHTAIETAKTALQSLPEALRKHFDWETSCGYGADGRMYFPVLYCAEFGITATQTRSGWNIEISGERNGAGHDDAFGEATVATDNLAEHIAAALHKASEKTLSRLQYLQNASMALFVA